MVEAGSPQIVIYDASELASEALPKGSPAGLPKSGNYTQSEIDFVLGKIAPVYRNLTARKLLGRAKFVVYGFGNMVVLSRSVALSVSLILAAGVSRLQTRR